MFVILATFLAYISPYVSPEYAWFFSLFGMAFFWLLILNVFFIIFWLGAKKFYFLFSLACIILGWGHVRSIIGFESTNDIRQEENISVMSFNCRSFYNFTDGKSTKKSILELLKKTPVDIVCFQEFPRLAGLPQEVATSTKLPYYYKPKDVSLAIFSKYPIIGKATIDQGRNGSTYASIDYKGNAIDIYNIHLKSNRISDEANKVIEEKDLREKRTWLGIKSVLGKIRATSSTRVEQARKIATHNQKSENAVVVCGDFNETPQSYVYRILSEGLKDSFCEKGFGMGSTYAGKIPALRIDFILMSNQLQINEHQIIKTDVSDHYPLISNFEF